ncbi:hypothetical protein ACMFMG_004215 [Clarireedia jacksonii]
MELLISNYITSIHPSIPNDTCTLRFSAFQAGCARINMQTTNRPTLKPVGVSQPGYDIPAIITQLAQTRSLDKQPAIFATGCSRHKSEAQDKNVLASVLGRVGL